MDITKVNLKYRKDIDGLRAIAVLSVMAFHSGIGALSGGFVGVDIFFVISGYLITSLIYREIEHGKFNFFNFYKRRVARLLPALSITLFIVFSFGFVFYDNDSFDNLGKEVFFSSFGAANIHFAEGINYFVKDSAFRPLLHLWSLGVEEQFYIVWPLCLFFFLKVSKKLAIYSAILLFAVSFSLSVFSVIENQNKGYFLLHYRAFEMLIGAITALLFVRSSSLGQGSKINDFLNFTGVLLIIIPILTLNEKSNFPGFNALWPCLGTALLIAFPSRGIVTQLLSSRILVFIGLISYPLYLYHQPLISFFHFFELFLPPLKLFLAISTICFIGAWFTYRYIEKPVREINSKYRKQGFIIITLLLLTIPFFSSLGLLVAKTNGLSARFKYLNPFASEISEAHSSSFHSNVERGFKVSGSNKTKALFVGDSLLQQYIIPLTDALDLSPEDVDTVTRGGCVLLKGTLFNDKFADISCNSIRKKLYNIDKKYDYVVLSQSWESYESSVLNFSNSDLFERWNELLENTTQHFLEMSKEVIIIGAHPNISGTLALQPNVSISEKSYRMNLKKLKVTNIDFNIAIILEYSGGSFKLPSK